MAISPYLFFDVTFSRSYRCWRGLGWTRKVFLSMLFHNNNLDRNSARVLAAYWACHVTYQLRISSMNLMLTDTNQKEQMPPWHLFTLTRGIQIRRQPIKNYKKNSWKILSNFLVRTLSYFQKKFKHEKTELKSCS